MTRVEPKGSTLKHGRQGGAAMVEFALVLPFLLAIIVGTIYYGFVFVLEISVENAARQAAVAATAIAPTEYSSQAAYRNAVDAVADSVVQSSLSWLPQSVLNGLPNGIANAADVCLPTDTCGAPQCAGTGASAGGTTGCVFVQLNLTGINSPLLPQVNLPVIGAIPPLPAFLSGGAKVLL